MRASKIDTQWARKTSGEVTHWSPVVHVDAIPSPLRNYTAVLDKNSGNVFFFTEEEGYVDFKVWDQKNMSGYGGREFSLFTQRYLEVDLETSAVITVSEYSGEGTGWWAVKGPWSSRSGVMNMLSMEFKELGWPMSIEASIFDEKKGYPVGGAVSIGWLFGEIQRLGAPYDLVPDPDFFEGEEVEPMWRIQPKEEVCQVQ